MALVGCLLAKALPLLVLANGASSESLASSTSALSFLVLGDWGGKSNQEPSNPQERCVADGMSHIAEKLSAEFVLALGDNVYYDGIRENNQDRFQSTFEDVFTAGSLKVPWYLIAGNHDHLGDINYQINYTDQTNRWNFPSLFYSFVKTLPSGKTAEFLMFDSVIAAGQSYYNESLGFVRAQGPEDAQKASDQWQWLEQKMAASNADYLFTAAHYPVWSACSHGPTQDLVDRLQPLMHKYGVTAHLAGHDHCLNHIEDGKAMYVLSGAGSTPGIPHWYKLENLDKLKDGAELKFHTANDNSGDLQSGFAAITLTDEAATVSYFGNDASLLYTSSPKPPRRAHLEISV